MPKDYKRHLKLNSDWEWVDAVEKSDYKGKPRDIPYEMFLNMTRDRDMLWIGQGKFVNELSEKHSLTDIEVDRLQYIYAKSIGDINKMNELKNKYNVR